MCPQNTNLTRDAHPLAYDFVYMDIPNLVVLNTSGLNGSDNKTINHVSYRLNL